MTLDLDAFLAQLPAEAPCWVPRDAAECNPAFKQLIPYFLLLDRDGRVLAYPRQGSERRLHGVWSVGVGGHVDEADLHPAGLRATLLASLRREIEEELGLTLGADPACLGLINEERSEVGQVHLGLVFGARLDDRGRLAPGQELRECRWVGRDGRTPYTLELWSELALGLLPDATDPMAMEALPWL